MVLVVFLPLLICLAISVVPIQLLRRRAPVRAQDYFVAAGPTPPAVIRNASIAYALPLAVFVALFTLGANGDVLPAIVASVSLGVGLSLLSVLRAPMLAFMDDALRENRSITVHAFVAQHHGNDARVRVLASALTVVALCGLVVGEAYGVAAVLDPVLPEGAFTAPALAFALVAFMLLYAIMSGHSGTMRAAQTLLGLFYFGLFGSAALLLYLEVSELRDIPAHGTLAVTYAGACGLLVFLYRRSRYVDTSPIPAPLVDQRDGAGSTREPRTSRLLRRFEKILNACISVFVALVVVVAAMQLYAEELPVVLRDVAATLQAGTRAPGGVLIALVLLPLCYPIIDVTNWQRIAAFARTEFAGEGERQRALTSFIRFYATETPLVWLFMCALGAIAVVATQAQDGAAVMQSVIDELAAGDNVVAAAALWLLLLGVFAAALSTMISMIAASLCAIRYDIVPAVWPELISEKVGPAQETLARRRTNMVGTVLYGLIFAASTVGIEYSQGSIGGTGLLPMLVTLFAAQLGLVPLVLAPALAQARGLEWLGGGGLSPAWALAILASGAVLALAGAVVFFATGQEFWLWAVVPGSLGAAVLLFAVARLSMSRGRRMG